MARPSSEQQSADATLRRAAVRASVAHSVHEAQPWRLEVGADQLHVLSDTSQWHPAVDPAGRLITLSAGCALFNARASLHADRVPHAVLRFPDAGRPELIATLHVAAAAPDPDAGLGVLAAAVPHRRLASAEVDRQPAAHQVAALQAAALGEDVELVVLSDPWLTGRLLTLREKAEPRPASPDATVSAALEGRGPGALAVLSTRGDRAVDWLRAGEAVQRILLTATRNRLGVSIVDELVQSPGVRGLVRHELALTGHPQAVILVGAPGREVRGRRRRLAEVLVWGARTGAPSYHL